MRSKARSSLLGYLTAVVVCTGAASKELPTTFFSASPGKPVIADTWEDVPKLYPKGWPGKWNGKPCLESQLATGAPIEFHRLSRGPIVAILPCFGIGNELWVFAKRDFEVVPLPMPSDFAGGGFALRRNTGHFVWTADSSTFTVTTSSDAVPYVAQRMTYAVGSSVQSIRLMKVESALYTGANRDNLQWETEWEGKPWRSAPKDPLLNP